MSVLQRYIHPLPEPEHVAWTTGRVCYAHL